MRRSFLNRLFVVLVVCLSALALGCKSEPEQRAFEPGSGMGQGDGSGGGRGGGQKLKKGEGVEITIFAASSTQNAVDLQAEFFKRKYDVNFKMNYASSGQLASQILQGAPADIFLSANTKWMDEVEKKGSVLDKHTFLSNKLVLVVPKGNPAGIKKLKDLLSDQVKRIAVAETESVPAGIYTKESLQKLGFWNGTSKKIVSGANVRVTLAYVERGEVDAGIVYVSDAKITPEIETIVALPADSHSEIQYPVALLASSKGNGMARKFFDFYNTHYSDKIYRTNGFVSNWEENRRLASKKTATTTTR